MKPDIFANYSPSFFHIFKKAFKHCWALKHIFPLVHLFPITSLNLLNDKQIQINLLTLILWCFSAEFQERRRELSHYPDGAVHWYCRLRFTDLRHRGLLGRQPLFRLLAHGKCCFGVLYQQCNKTYRLHIPAVDPLASYNTAWESSEKRYGLFFPKRAYTDRGFLFRFLRGTHG